MFTAGPDGGLGTEEAYGVEGTAEGAPLVAVGEAVVYGAEARDGPSGDIQGPPFLGADRRVTYAATPISLQTALSSLS
ncbi:hypothetical protein J8N05_14575 [Streptomyces sp. BH-SS-21]|uniref:Uncharacterized protein n=1 Tax=Streptomyces liliiviolaceus TaxID=2823109 RepID=A0A940XXA8_9ACTN|nr:hypothetical protein [Streptomyces liliiviolaceus]MBQ0849427.1 hypothetical protein [Streptomyces liliiviolaceus]